jgi:CheY-like chemotaxis protein
MPKMEGFEVMEEMQKDQELRGIPVIVVSNSGQPVEIDKAQALGARDWLIKTEFNPREVVEKVVKQIGK